MTQVSLLASTSPNQSIRQGLAGMTNMYLEARGQSTSGVFDNVAYPTPGMKSAVSLTGSSVRDLIAQKGNLYAVVDNKVYKIDSNNTPTLLGNLYTSYGRVSSVRTVNHVIWVDGVYGYYYQLDTATFGQITDANFPNGTDYITYQAGYVIARIPETASVSGKWAVSSTTDPTNWSSLTNYIFASSQDSDKLISIFSDKKLLYTFSEYHIEVWYPSGDINNWAQQVGLQLSTGISAKYSLARFNNQIFFLGQSNSGNGDVYMLENYNIVPVSDAPISAEINAYATVSDAFAFIYDDRGHAFYVLTFPTMGKTLVYDIDQKKWHRRSSYLPSLIPSAPYNRYRPNCYAFFNGQHYVGDCISGNIYTLDAGTYQEAGQTIIRDIVTPTIYIDKKLISINSLEIEFEPGQALLTGQGSSPILEMRVSRDGGFTWDNWLQTSLGGDGAMGARATFGLLGAGRYLVFQFRITDPIKAMILGARADINYGQDTDPTQ